jgi:hypothetical protein
MSEDQLRQMVRLLLDSERSAEERTDASTWLARSDDDDALDTLLTVAQADGEDPTVARAAGAGVAKILWRHGRHPEAPLAHFNSEAYLGFDETIASHQRG